MRIRNTLESGCFFKQPRLLEMKQSSRHLAFVTAAVDDMVLLRCRFLQSDSDVVLSFSSLALTFFEAAEGPPPPPPPTAAAAEWGSGLSAGPPPSPAWRNISKASSSAASRLAVMSQNCLPSDETTLM